MEKDERLELSLLEQVSRLDDDREGSDFRVDGYSDEQVRRHVLMLRDEDLIAYDPFGHDEDPDAMWVRRLTPAGRDRMGELQQRLRSPVRYWLARNWKWLATGVAVPVAIALLAAAVSVYLSKKSGG